MTAHEPTLAEVESANVERLTGLAIPARLNERSAFQARLASTWGAGSLPEWQEGHCKCCGRSMEATKHRFDMGDVGVLDATATICDDCQPLVDSHYSPDRKGLTRVSLCPEWEERCPQRLRELIEGGGYPPGFDQESMRRVLQFGSGERKGLALIGPSSAGKTTSLWALFRKIERAGTTPVFLTGVELGRTLAKAARDIEAIDWLCRARLLMIDDFGKERATPGASALLWELLDRRYQNNLPVVLSTRYNGDELRARFNEDQLGGDIVRRLNELCRKVQFSLRS